jgi:hypothetical protein
MADEQPHTYSGKFFVPFDFAGLMTMSGDTLTEAAKRNSKFNSTLQAFGKEWSGFVQARLREDYQLFQTLAECREAPSMQRAYMQFWEKALSQYEEEAQRLMRLAQGAVEETVQAAQEVEASTGKKVEEAVQAVQETAEITSGRANGRRATNRTAPPSR